MGAVFLLYLLYPFIIIVGAILLGAVIISLIVFINNLKNGANNKWPTKNIVGAIISGIIFTIALIIIIVCFMGTFDSFSIGSPASNPSSSATAIALMAMKL